MIVRTEEVRGGTFETADGLMHRWEPALGQAGGRHLWGGRLAAGLTFALGQGRPRRPTPWRSPRDAVREWPRTPVS